MCWYVTHIFEDFLLIWIHLDRTDGFKNLHSSLCSHSSTIHVYIGLSISVTTGNWVFDNSIGNETDWRKIIIVSYLLMKFQVEIGSCAIEILDCFDSVWAMQIENNSKRDFDEIISFQVTLLYS